MKEFSLRNFYICKRALRSQRRENSKPLGGSFLENVELLTFLLLVSAALKYCLAIERSMQLWYSHIFQGSVIEDLFKIAVKISSVDVIQLSLKFDKNAPWWFLDLNGVVNDQVHYKKFFSEAAKFSK